MNHEGHEGHEGRRKKEEGRRRYNHLARSEMIQ